jgi:hypothetical protein
MRDHQQQNIQITDAILSRGKVEVGGKVGHDGALGVELDRVHIKHAKTHFDAVLR